MFSKTSVAVLAGIALTGSLLARPTVVAAPASGRAAAWGYNAYGQLGNNTTTDSAVPVAVNTAGPLAGRTVTAITAGGDHSCAVADGRAYCWGYNNVGQLGNNTTTNSAVPVAVNTAGPLAGRTVTAITAGDSHTCAVAEGRASCWGKNNFGQLGNNSTTNSAVPVPVDTAGVLAVKTVTAITAGAYSSFAVAEGKAFCWGSNVYGQLGNNSTTNTSVPVPVDTAGVLAGRPSPRSPPAAFMLGCWLRPFRNPPPRCPG